MSKFMRMTPARRLIAAVATSLLLAACGASTILSAGISGTGIVVGVLTGFGSIYVNGVEYDIDQAEFNIDGQTGFGSAAEAQQNLAIGMVVRLEAKDNGDGTGTAVRVIYDDAVEGPIETVPVADSSNRMRFTVLGQEVIADQIETSFDGMSFSELAQGLVVEVSGFADANGSILATRIEYKGMLSPNQSLVELHGQISNLNQLGHSFILGATTVYYDQDTRFEDMQQDDLADGQLVEVKGVYRGDGSIFASKIESEEDDIREISTSEGQLEVQGVIYDFVSASEFFVNGVQVDGSGLSQTEIAALADGVEVEVKGPVENGVLIAESIEFRGSEAELQADLTAVDAANDLLTVRFGAAGPELQLRVTSESRLEDDRMDAPNSALTLAELSAAVDEGADAVSISIRMQGDSWVVVNLQLKDPLSKYEAEGVVETWDSQTMTIGLFGLSLQLTGIDPASLVGVSPGVTRVGLEDTDMNGVFDSAKISGRD